MVNIFKILRSTMTKYVVESYETNNWTTRIKDKLDIIPSLVLYSNLSCCTNEPSE